MRRWVGSLINDVPLRGPSGHVPGAKGAARGISAPLASIPRLLGGCIPLC